MKTADGAFHQCYNGQVAVDEHAQVIVAATMSNTAPDVNQLLGVLDTAAKNCGRRPRQLVADAGYWSEHNATEVAQRGIDALIATGRLKHNEPVPPAPRGRIPAAATLKERMARKLRTKPGRAGYARRKAIVEPIFGQIKTRQAAGHARLRGLDGATGEWILHAFCHNLRKLHNAGGIAALAAT